jgi:hypothetical protein
MAARRPSPNVAFSMSLRPMAEEAPSSLRVLAEAADAWRRKLALGPASLKVILSAAGDAAWKGRFGPRSHGAGYRHLQDARRCSERREP